MRSLQCFAVYDVKAEAYLRPFFSETRGLAVRSFGDVVNDPSHEFCKHAEDYTLFAVGIFDTEKGSFVSKVESLGNALTFMRAVDK